MSAAGAGNESRCVLVVDDEEAICDLIRLALGEVGVLADCANSDRGAYAALDSGRGYAALVVDVDLGPGTTGFDVARAARAGNPTLPVLYMSGQVSERSVANFGVPDSSFIAKPFRLDQLLAFVDRLDREDPA